MSEQPNVNQKEEVKAPAEGEKKLCLDEVTGEMVSKK
jgi:hypothetical protein